MHVERDGISVAVIGAPGCHYCQDADEALAELGAVVHVEHVDAASDRGRSLLSEHRAPILPLVLVDGAFFSYGRLPRKKLRALIQQRGTLVP